MRELEERIDVCERRLAIDPRTGTLAHPELQEETWINGAWLRDWILSERLVEDLFGDRMDEQTREYFLDGRGPPTAPSESSKFGRGS